MAKSIEDTLFYRWHELTALNEVGSEVELLERAGAATLHEWATEMAKQWPSTMTTLSTHDTKRSEDVRATLIAISGDEDAWRECSTAAAALADVMNVDRPSAHLVWQTIAALGFNIDAERLEGYLLKALREAKVHTAWVDGDDAYEQSVLRFAAAVLNASETDSGTINFDAAQTLAWQLRFAIQGARKRNADAMRLVGHTQKAVQLLLPGVPDTYQGSETPAFTLVDPDNRRPVDYEELRKGIDQNSSRAWLIRRLLADDVRSAASPGAEYEPVTTSDERVFGFVRTPSRSRLETIAEAGRHVVEAIRPGEKSAPTTTAVAVVALRRTANALRGNDFYDAQVDLPTGSWRHAFTDDVIRVDGPIRMGDLPIGEFGHLHVLLREGE